MNLFDLSKKQELLIAIGILAFAFGMKKLFGSDALEVFSFLILFGIVAAIWLCRYYVAPLLMYIGTRYFLQLRKGWSGFVGAFLCIGLSAFLCVQHFVILPPRADTVICKVRLHLYVEPLFSFRGIQCSLLYYFFGLLCIAMIVGMVLYCWRMYKDLQ